MKILVVDDSVGIRMIAKKIFRKLGFSNVVIADDGTTALDKLNQGPFDLVVADWSMPKMSGIELVKEMRKSDSLKEIPFLLVTADDDQDNLLEAIRSGINNFMPKPYEASTLLKKIEQIFVFQEKLKKRAQQQ